MNVGSGYVDGVKSGWIVVEDAKEVVIIVEKVLVFWTERWRRGRRVR